jgi:hypothetical protein
MVADFAADREGAVFTLISQCDERLQPAVKIHQMILALGEYVRKLQDVFCSSREGEEGVDGR